MTMDRELGRAERVVLRAAHPEPPKWRQAQPWCCGQRPKHGLTTALSKEDRMDGVEHGIADAMRAYVEDFTQQDPAAGAGARSLTPFG